MRFLIALSMLLVLVGCKGPDFTRPCKVISKFTYTADYAEYEVVSIGYGTRGDGGIKK